jgi:hypothetical protein
MKNNIFETKNDSLCLYMGSILLLLLLLLLKVGAIIIIIIILIIIIIMRLCHSSNICMHVLRGDA